MKRAIFVFALLGFALLNACKKDNTAIATNIDCSTVTYSGTIQPLTQQNCSGSSCHSSNGASTVCKRKCFFGNSLRTYDLIAWRPVVSN